MTSERSEDDWKAMFDALDRRIAPLLAAGWSIKESFREASWEHGDSVAYDLTRRGVVIEVEHYEHGQLVGYPVEAPDPTEEDPEPTEPLFDLEDPDEIEWTAAFAAVGWLS